MAGGSIGQMLIPLIMQSLFDGFGLRGGLLIYSGVVLQALVAALLLQPSRWHWKLDDTPNVEVELLEKRPETPPVLREVETLSAAGKSRPTSWTGNVIVKASADIRRVQQMDGDIVIQFHLQIFVKIKKKSYEMICIFFRADCDRDQ